MTRKQIALQFRRSERARASPRDDSAGAVSPLEIESIPDPAGSTLEVLWDAEWEENLPQAALERVKVHVNPKRFRTFSFSLLKGWPVAEVKRTLAVTAAQVSLARHRVGALLKKEVKRLKNQAGQAPCFRASWDSQ